MKVYALLPCSLTGMGANVNDAVKTDVKVSVRFLLFSPLGRYNKMEALIKLRTDQRECCDGNIGLSAQLRTIDPRNIRKRMDISGESLM